MRGGEEEGLCDDIVRALGHLWSFHVIFHVTIMCHVTIM